MVKFYLLVSIRPDAIDFRLLKHANHLEKFHIVINTTDKDLEEELVTYCVDKGLEYTVTESDGTPATGKNSMLDVFLKSDNEYAVCIDGDDVLTEYGRVFYTELGEDENPPDLLCLYRQGHILNAVQQTELVFPQDKTPTIHYTEDDIYHFLCMQDEGEGPEQYRKWAKWRDRNNKWMNKFSENNEYMCRMVWFSRKCAEMTCYDNEITIGEDVVQFLKHKRNAHDGNLRMFRRKDDEQPTYLTYMGGTSITRPMINPHSWDWLGPFNEKLQIMEDNGEMPKEYRNLPDWKNA